MKALWPSPRPAVAGCWASVLYGKLREEEPDSLPVDSSEVLKLDRIYPALARLAAREKGLRLPQLLRDLSLSQTGIDPRLLQAGEEVAIPTCLSGAHPGFSGRRCR